jgi:hypothetical protein
MALLVLFRGVGQVATLHSHLDARRRARSSPGESATTTEPTDVSVGVSAVAGVLLTAGEDSIVKAFDRGNSRELLVKTKSFGGGGKKDVIHSLVRNMEACEFLFEARKQ